MPRYVDVDKLIEEYDRVHIGAPGGARKLMVDAPTADVQEVKHGEWLLLDECANEGVYCSLCHKKVYKKDYANQKIKSKYCPNCGAKMDERSKA